MTGVLCACQSAPPSPQRIAIVSAFHAELAPLLERTSGLSSQTIGGITFTTGILAGHDVVLFSSDVGMVNAAMNTQLALDHFEINRIIFSGIGGGLLPDARIGDVVIPAQWAQYQSVIYARQHPDGTAAPPGWLTNPLPPYGISFPSPVTVHGESITWFPADAPLSSGNSPGLNRCLVLAPETCQPDTPHLITRVNGVSGQGYVDNADFAAYLHTAFGAAVVDMESAAVAQVAYNAHLPVTVVRGISDLPGITSEDQMQTFSPLAVDNAAQVVLTLLKSSLHPAP